LRKYNGHSCQQNNGNHSDECEYIRHGVANIFMANEPLKGRRLIEVTKLKTKKDWTRFIKRIADEMCLNAKKITHLITNLALHCGGSHLLAPQSPSSSFPVLGGFFFPIHHARVPRPLHG
jgi:hypothetical protein